MADGTVVQWKATDESVTGSCDRGREICALYGGVTDSVVQLRLRLKLMDERVTEYLGQV